ncbi:LOW QUALITY PROTEIN: hypothetical protein Cgig2_014400 [Carnegiea gigantea]|uniref:DUF8040 domain-containing protein n=1 Tax=Carnegiea gigantea TaxID=171969 RepID=A0A9Q1K0L2_9CARY|nr:LOW QUALITY PROTEIN: hypothetical protein Cgig2_014400 [Carnegiea gigantea]
MSDVAYIIAPTERKSRNWTNKEDGKFLDVLIEQKAQGATQFEWSVAKALLKVLIGQTGVGVNPVTGAVKVTDFTWEKFLKFPCESAPNLDKIKAVVHGRHATGYLSFSLVMGAFVNGVEYSRICQWICKSICVIVIRRIRMATTSILSAGEESRSSLRTIHTNARKHRTEGGSSGEGRQLRQELGESSVLDAQVQNALEVLSLKEESRLHPPPSTYQQVLTKLRQHPGVAARGPELIFSVMEYIRREQDFDYFVVFDDDDINTYELEILGIMDDDEDRAVDTLILYTLTGSSSQQRTALHPRLPRIIGDESGRTFIHRVLNGYRAYVCRQLLRLDRDAFIHLVNVIIEKCLIDEGRFIKVVEIVATSLYIFTRGASYRYVEIRFRHSRSTISNYHNQVLEALVKLSVNIVRPYRSQDEVPPKIAQKPGFYWPYFKARC